MTQQVAITIVAPVKPADVDTLRATLEAMGDDPAANDVIPFAKMAALHFARLVLLDADTGPDGSAMQAKLVLLLDCDGPAARRLSELVVIAGDRLDEVFQHCEGYPAAAGRDRARRRAYLKSCLVGAAASYVNTIGRTASEVRQEMALREAIEAFLDRERDGLTGKPAVDARLAIRRFVSESAEFRWASSAAGRPGRVERLRDRLHLAAGVAVLLAVSPVVLVAAPFYIFELRRRERSDPAPRLDPGDARVRRLAAAEDHLAQNQFTAVGHLKAGAFRRYTAVAVLALVNFGARHLFSGGDLSGVKSIHFARWVFLEDKRRMIFASNYDGSLENYMDDFIDKVAWGLNAVFSNGVDYPRTNWLIKDGAHDEEAFKAFIRTRQVPTQVWYSAFGSLSARNIENNACIRAGLSGEMDEVAAAAWLRRL